MSHQSYPAGVDCVWLATDRHGCVAAFVTAGAGPIPASLLRFDGEAADDIEEQIALLSATSKVRLHVAVPRPDSFIAIASRGLFVYDWSDVHRTASEFIRAYELVARPETPIRAPDASLEVASLIARSVTMNEVSFERESILDVHDHAVCVGPGTAS